MEKDEPRVIAEAPEYSIYRDGTIIRTVARPRTRAGKILKPWLKDGYPAICLRHNEVVIKRLVHRIVCTTYNGTAPSPKHEVAHIDGNPGNCHADNLRWSTHRENEEDKKRHGTYLARTYAKLTPEQVKEIRATPHKWGVCKELAEKFGVVHQTISQIRKDFRYWPEVV